MARAEGAGEGLADVGGAEGRWEVYDGREDEGVWVYVGDIVGGGRAVGEGGRDGGLGDAGGGEWCLEGELGDE